MSKILITGTAGFIGFSLANKLIAQGHNIVGLDCINDYYDTNLKYDRLAFAGIDKEQINENVLVQSKKHSNYYFIKLNLEDSKAINKLFESRTPIVDLCLSRQTRQINRRVSLPRR